MSRLWRCPDAGHAGVLAPERLGRDDVRRVCWPCSESAGVIVRRVMQSAERKKSAKMERARIARQTRAEVKRAALVLENDRRRGVHDDVKRARTLRFWKQRGRIAAQNVRAEKISLHVDPNRDGGPLWGEIMATPDVPRWQIALQVLSRLADRASKACDMPIPSLLIGAACEFFPELDDSYVRIMAMFKLRDPHARDAMREITTVLLEKFNSPAEEQR